MNDILGSLFGKKHCGWCHDQPTTWWERLTEQDQHGESTTAWKRWVFRVQLWLGEHVPIWRLGEMWHYRFHVDPDDPRRERWDWCDSRSIGDIVCDCQGKHQAIVEFRDKDSVVLEDGYVCSLYHCCTEPNDVDCHSDGFDIEDFWDRKDND